MLKVLLIGYDGLKHGLKHAFMSHLNLKRK